MCVAYWPHVGHAPSEPPSPPVDEADASRRAREAALHEHAIDAHAERLADQLDLTHEGLEPVEQEEGDHDAAELEEDGEPERSPAGRAVRQRRGTGWKFLEPSDDDQVSRVIRPAQRRGRGGSGTTQLRSKR